MQSAPPRPSRPRRRRAAAVLLALLLALAGALTVAAPAAAHDYLVSSSPAANSTVTRPIPDVTITFDAAVLGTGNGSTVLSVIGPNGRHFETACPVVKNDDVSTAVRLGPPGTYRISWRIVSSDGHPVSDSVAFRYAPASSAGTTEGTSQGPSCGNAAVGTDRASPVSSASSSTGVLVLVAVVVGVLVILVAAAVIVAVVVTRRRV